AWLLSMYKRPYHFKGSHYETFDEFLSCPWPALGRETADSGFQNVIHLWNRKNRSYKQLESHSNCGVVRYEDLLLNTFHELNRVRRITGASIKPCFPCNYEIAAKHGDGGLNIDHYKRYYGEERWKSHLTTRSIDF